MGRAVLVIDTMPTRCADCPLRNSATGEPICHVILKEINENEYYKEKPNWCPLKSIPEKIDEIIK